MDELLEQLRKLSDYFAGRGEFQSGMALAYQDAISRIEIALQGD